MSDQQERSRDGVVPTPTGRSRDGVVFTRTERSRDEAVLAVNGPLMDESVDEFKLRLDGLLAGGWPIVTLDLTKVKVIASQCLGKIVFLMKKLEESRRKLRIRGCDPELYAQFTSIRFDQIIDISLKA